MTPDELRSAGFGDHEMLERLTAALGADDRNAIADAARALTPAETARLVLRLSPRRARRLLRMLDDAPSLRLLEALDPSVTEVLLDAEQRERLAKIVGKLPTEDAADLLAEAPAELAAAVLTRLGHPKALVAALDHRADSAGAIMQRRFVAAPLDWTIDRLIADIREHAERIDALYAVYVIDEERRLMGFLKVRDLLLLPPDARVGDVMRTPATQVTAETDRARVVQVADRERLPVLPVVDAEGRLVGRVTAEELRAIDRAEAAEDLKLMAGLRPDSSAADGPLRIVPRRLPWLAAGLIGAGTAAVVVGSYEDTLTEAAILASLIPIVMSLAGNAGIQASTVTVQAQAAGALWVGDIVGRVLREVGGALLNGLLVGLIVAAGILGFAQLTEIDRPLMLGLTAALTLILVTVQASAIGSLVPLLLERLGFDPAVATGVFITTSNDVVGVLIFFVIATSLYI